MDIRLLAPEEAPLFLDHLSRNIPTSGLGETPLFTVMSRQTPINFSARLESTARELALPVTDHGWQRIFGAFVSHAGNELIVGAAGLSTARQSPMQMHRALLGMGIELDHRKNGLGRALLTRLISWAKTQPQLAWIDLGVFAENAPARRLYQKLGFLEVGRVTDCFRVDGQRIDDIQMALDLRQ